MAEFSVSSWANLPPELLFLIAHRLETDTEICNFRSVCKGWLASSHELPRKSPPLPMQLHFHFRVEQKMTLCPFTLFKTSVFRLEVPGVIPKKSWLIKVSEQANGRFRLMNPFSPRPVKNFPNGLLPKEVNLYKFRVSEVCTRYYLRLNSRGSQDQDSIPCYKATLPSNFESIEQKFLVIDQHARLICPKDGTRSWNRIDRHSEYLDFVLHKGKFFVLDWNGVARVFDESTLETTAPLFVPHDHPCLCGQWYLIKSRGDLYLVGKIQHRCLPFGSYHQLMEEGDIDEQFVIPHGRIEFKVYKLDDRDPGSFKWSRVTDLGDQIFFISRDCSYSVSFHDFEHCRSGNIIIFVDEFVIENDDQLNEPAGIAETRVGFINLKVGRVLRPLSFIRPYYNIFWPPPNWMRGNIDQCSSSTSSTTAT